jgi:nitrogen fixation NifU-like protein
MKNDSLDELYQSIILEHNKRPSNYGHLGCATHTAEGFNPLCGDKCTVHLNVVDQSIESIKFEAACCAICKASASMMTNALLGKSLAQAEKFSLRVDRILSDDNLDYLESDGDLVSLNGVKNFPARIKCASLPWRTYQAAISQKNRAVLE